MLPLFSHAPNSSNSSNNLYRATESPEALASVAHLQVVLMRDAIHLPGELTSTLRDIVLAAEEGFRVYHLETERSETTHPDGRESGASTGDGDIRGGQADTSQ